MRLTDLVGLACGRDYLRRSSHGEDRFVASRHPYESKARASAPEQLML